MFEVTTIKPFGVRIEGINLSEELDTSGRDEFRDLLAEHGLLVVPGQDLSMSGQQRVMSYVGPVDIDPYEHVPYVSNVDGAWSDGYRQTIELAFHIDKVCKKDHEPALSLFAVDVVDGASSTRFASGVRGYSALPPDLQEHIKHLEVVHVFTSDRSAPPAVDIPDGTDTTTGPIVRVDEQSSRPYLYLSWNEAHSVKGLSYLDGRALLETLFSHLLSESNVYEHVWHQGDFVLWNNNAVSHQRGNLRTVGRRILQKGYCGTNKVSGHTGSLSKAELEAFFN